MSGICSTIDRNPVTSHRPGRFPIFRVMFNSRVELYEQAIVLVKTDP